MDTLFEFSFIKRITVRQNMFVFVLSFRVIYFDIYFVIIYFVIYFVNLFISVLFHFLSP